MVSTQRERPNFINGADVLFTHDCNPLHQKNLLIGEPIVLNASLTKVRASRVNLKLTRHVELPPHTEVLASYKPSKGTKFFGML